MSIIIIGKAAFQNVILAVLTSTNEDSIRWTESYINQETLCGRCHGQNLIVLNTAKSGIETLKDAHKKPWNDIPGFDHSLFKLRKGSL